MNFGARGGVYFDFFAPTVIIIVFGVKEVTVAAAPWECVENEILARFD